MPGMENLAPLRTETRSGSEGSPRWRPIWSSTPRRAVVTSVASDSGTVDSLRYARHASVVIVKPGGTGRPSFVISARLAPFPPRRSFMDLSPSEKSYTYLTIVVLNFRVCDVRPIDGPLPGVRIHASRDLGHFKTPRRMIVLTCAQHRRGRGSHSLPTPPRKTQKNAGGAGRQAHPTSIDKRCQRTRNSIVVPSPTSMRSPSFRAIVTMGVTSWNEPSA